MDIILNYLHSGFTQVFSFVVLLGVLVFVHELGHFLVAIWCGVRVEVFSLGFGKKIFQYQKGDTNYCISLIPLGGYVKMYGEQPGDEIPEDQKKYSFTNKKVSQRLAVVIAGPLMNLFFAFLVFMVVAFSGETFKSPIVGEVTDGSTAATVGFASGDKILKVNDTEIKTWDHFQDMLDLNLDQSIKITIQAENKTEPQTIEAKVNSKNNPNVVTAKKFIGEIAGLSMFSYAPVVAVSPTSELYKLGMRYGDRIESINDLKVTNFRDLDKTLILATKTDPAISSPQKISFKIVRNEIDSKKMSKHTFVLENTPPVSTLSLKTLGLESTQLYIDKVMPDSPAEKAGLKKGDKIVSINKKPLVIWDDILTSIKSFSESEKALTIEIQRDLENLSLSITPQMTTHMTMHGTEEKRFTIGISPFIMYSQPETVVISEHTLSGIASRAFEKTWDVSVMTVLSFVRLIQNQISPKNIGGIFSIAQAANETFKMGLSAFLQMMGLISINLFILNLLPIPVLDGGHIVFYCIEAIKGSPLSLSKVELAHKVGMILLFSLMIFALFNDFKRMLGFM
jgi:regulator of sigma E protease